MKLDRSVAMQMLHAHYFKIIFTMLHAHCSMYAKSACIIIHGTWAQDETWYRPGGDFFESVKSCNNEIKIVDEVISFSWSGKLGHPAQVHAAKNLANLIYEKPNHI